MAKWTCRCGNPMNDHDGPDKNYYRVFSDVEWDSIKTDDDGNLNLYNDLPVQSYDVYRCPVCGRLMILGEGNIFESYIKEE